jgi:four helix bundle protein
VSGIPSNIAEGFRRFGPKEFVRYLDFAFASAGETADWLDDGVAREHWTEADLARARQLLRRLNVGLVRLMKYLRSPAAKANAGR